jgi:hypothetical protein
VSREQRLRVKTGMAAMRWLRWTGLVAAGVLGLAATIRVMSTRSPYRRERFLCVMPPPPPWEGSRELPTSVREAIYWLGWGAHDLNVDPEVRSLSDFGVALSSASHSRRLLEPTVELDSCPDGELHRSAWIEQTGETWELRILLRTYRDHLELHYFEAQRPVGGVRLSARSGLREHIPALGWRQAMEAVRVGANCDVLGTR